MRDERQNRKVVQNCPQHFGYVGGIVIAAVLPRRGMMGKPKATARLKASASASSPTPGSPAAKGAAVCTFARVTLHRSAAFPAALHRGFATHFSLLSS